MQEHLTGGQARTQRLLRPEISRLASQHIDEAARVVADVFLEGEPMTRTLLENARSRDEGHSRDESGHGPHERKLRDDMRGFTKLVCLGAVDAGLSFVARDEITGKIIGFALNERYELDEEAPECHSLKPVFGVLDQHKQAFVSRSAERRGSRPFHIFMVGSCPEYAGMGLTSTLIGRSLELARALAARGELCEAVTEATSGSQGIFAKFGLKEEHRVVYESIPEFETMKHAEAKWMQEAGDKRRWPGSSQLMTLELSSAMGLAPTR